MKKTTVFLLLFICFGLSVREAVSQTNPAAQAVPYNQDFSGLAHTSTTYPAGWQGWTISTLPGATFNTAGPTADRALVASSTAAINSGNVHNYNGKIGYLNNASLDLTLVLAINTTGLTGVGVTYDIMTIRNPYDGTVSNNRINEVTLQYRVGTSGAWTTLTGIEYQNNTTLQTGAVTTPQNSQTKNIALPAATDNQPVVQLRWASRQVSGAGGRPSFALDNITVATGIVADAAPSVSSTTPNNGTTGVPLSSNVSVTFSEPVNAPAGAFSISCANSGAHTFSISGGPTTFTLDPNVNFTGNELCTVTVVAAQVADVDTNDPPDNMAADYVFSFTTVDPASCGTTFTPIFTIQGSGAASPIVGSSVTTEGVVIGDFQGSSNLSGFYIQDPTGDGNTATSDGIYIFDGSSPAIDVSVGDRVRITGTVSETFNNTQMTPTTIIVCSTGNPLPSPVAYDLPEPVNGDLERVENMLVTFPEPLTVTGNFDEGRFGEVVLSSEGRLFQQNSFDRPGTAGSIAVQALNQRRYIVLDDGKSGQNLDPTAYFNATPTRRLGDTTTGLTGVLTFDFSEYRVQPTGSVTFTNANPRSAAPTITGLKAVGMNVLNYFNGNGAGGGFPTSRGANTLAEFNRQRDKIIAAIIAINPDVVGISEMENDGTGAASAIQDLVNGLNAASAPGTYTFVTEPGPGTDEIKVSIIYKPGVLSPSGAAVNDPNPVHNRPPLAQTFQQISNGEKFTFIVNHFKSKGGTCPTSGGDADAGDGQGCFNATRVAQANALLTFIQQRKAAAGDPDVLSVGDYNAYGFEDPMFTLEDDASDALADGGGGLYSQTKRYIAAADRYSYQFGNESGELDHAMATKTMTQQITGAAIWHNNADEPIVLDYNVENKSAAQQALNVGTAYRTSDHDPVVVGLSLLQPTAADGAITGRITDANGNPVAGAVVNLSGTQNRKFITDANGVYRFDNVETNGFYTVKPARVDLSFSPAERSFTSVANVTNAGFTGSAVTTSASPLDTPEYFVRQQYLDFLGREPDEAGFNYWSDQILNCGTDTGCREQKRINVSAAYFFSIEFQQTAGLVDGLYRASFGRAPRYQEFVPDAARIGDALIVGKSGWIEQLSANKQSFIDAWVGRPGFHAAYDGLSDSQYVNTLTSNTGVDFSDSERAALVESLANESLTRAGALKTIAEDERFVNAKRNATFVMMEYFGYLRREPDAEGFAFWLDKLNQYGGNFEQAEMVRAFIISGEYRNRFQH